MNEHPSVISIQYNFLIITNIMIRQLVLSPKSDELPDGVSHVWRSLGTGHGPVEDC